MCYVYYIIIYICKKKFIRNLEVEDEDEVEDEVQKVEYEVEDEEE